MKLFFPARRKSPVFRSAFIPALTLGFLGAAAFMTARPALAEEAEDLLVQYDPATQTINMVGKTPGADIFNRTLEQFGSVYINDSGFDVFPSIDEDPPYGAPGERNIRQATIEQVAISPGLFAIYQYDGVTPVFGQTSATGFQWTIAETKPPAPAQALHSEADDPYYLHQHFNFSSGAPGTYFFDFRITNVVLTDGTAISAPSQTFRINYTTQPAAAAPEPGAAALVATGLPLLGSVVALRRRKRRTL